MTKRRLATAIALMLVVACPGPDAPRSLTVCRSPSTGIVKATFHGDPLGRSRVGWNDRESELAPERVAQGMRSSWTSAPFESITLNGTKYVGRTYASPLYADGVTIARGPGTGTALSVVFTATSNGDVYAIAASDTPCTEGTIPAGAVLWRTRLVVPDVPPKLDARDESAAANAQPRFPGIAVGTVSTPVLDLAASVLYVTAMAAGKNGGLPVWKVFAVDVATGDVKPGWPVVLNRDAVEAVNTNGPAYFDEDARFVSQRSALALSPEGDRVYIAFGGYWDEAVGWLVAVDTHAARIASSFSGASDTLLENGQRKRHANAGMWAPGGPAVDETGRVYVTTGNSPEDDGVARVARSWGSSMLRLGRDLRLEAAYTPYDYCDLDKRDVDISGSSPALLPSLGDATSTPRLVAFGGKAGVVYLLDRDGLAAAGDVRPPCSSKWDDAEHDSSLLPSEPSEPYCDGFGADKCAKPTPSTRCVRGPLQVFGPMGDDASVDRAKMRSTPAFFRGDDGAFLYVSGSTKAERCSPDGKPPSLVRLRVVTEPGKPAWLARDAADDELRFVNPGSPIVSSDGGRSPVVWVVDQNAKRSHPLLDPATPAPIVYAVDGRTMKRLWSSGPADLEPGGKYVTPVIAHGVVYVATDRLHAFVPAR